MPYYQQAFVTQRSELLALNQRVGGSNPPGRKRRIIMAKWKATHELTWFGRLLRRIELKLTGHWTYCDRCGRFSPQKYCPYC